MAQPQRHFGAAPRGTSPISEMLVIPFHFEDRPVGTLWVVSLDEDADADSTPKTCVSSRVSRASRRSPIGSRSRRTAWRSCASRRSWPTRRLLQAISSELITENDEKGFRERLLDAAISIMHSDCASLQMFKEDASGGHLELIAHRGFSQEAIDRWQTVTATTRTSCGEVLRTRRRVIVSDVTKCEFMAGSEDLAFYLRGGIHAVQSTPLLSRSGRLHGRLLDALAGSVHSPSDRDLRLLDILARQAADLLERMLAEERLRDSDRRKEEFLATLAHELRNPLAPILNAVQCLEPHGAGRIRMLQWARDVIVRQTTHLTRLVDDLLDVSRINHDRLEIRKELVDLARIVHTAVETTQPFVEHAAPDARRSSLPRAAPDGGRRSDATLAGLREPHQQRREVLRRGGEHRRASSRRRATRCTSACAITASASSPASSRASSISSARVRPSYVNDQGGLGIGLTLVKRLVEMHGGTVSASSAGLGLGSEFVVRLPTRDARSRMRPSRSDDALGAPHGQPRVLVVDDHADGATSMCRLLRVLGYDARQASDGLAGLDAAAEFRPDVVLLDIAMPRLSGYDVARRLRAEPWGKQMFLIAVTGWGQDSDKQRATDAGFDCHLTKPVAVAELTRALSSIAASA